MDSLQSSVWHSRVNSFLGIIFVGSIALGAVLLICQAAFGENPIANAFAAQTVAETQLPQ